MKKSSQITLVLLTLALVSCREQPRHHYQQKVYMRSDSSASYSSTSHSSGGGVRYYAFRPYGVYHSGYYGNGSYGGGSYSRTGYYNSTIGKGANVGTNSTKSGVVRGGFGGGGRAVAS